MDTADEEILDDNDYLDVWGKFNGKKPSKLKERVIFMENGSMKSAPVKTGT